MSSFHILKMDFQNTIVKFQVSTLTFMKMQSLTQNRKTLGLGLGTKNLLFEYFRVEFKKTIVIFEISTLKVFKMQCFVQNFKNFKSVTKNALFGYF